MTTFNVGDKVCYTGTIDRVKSLTWPATITTTLLNDWVETDNRPGYAWNPAVLRLVEAAPCDDWAPAACEAWANVPQPDVTVTMPHKVAKGFTRHYTAAGGFYLSEVVGLVAAALDDA